MRSFFVRGGIAAFLLLPAFAWAAAGVENSDNPYFLIAIEILIGVAIGAFVFLYIKPQMKKVMESQEILTGYHREVLEELVKVGKVPLELKTGFVALDGKLNEHIQQNMVMDGNVQSLVNHLESMEGRLIDRFAQIDRDSQKSEDKRSKIYERIERNNAESIARAAKQKADSDANMLLMMEKLGELYQRLDNKMDANLNELHEHNEACSANHVKNDERVKGLQARMEQVDNIRPTNGNGKPEPKRRAAPKRKAAARKTSPARARKPAEPKA